MEWKCYGMILVGIIVCTLVYINLYSNVSYEERTKHSNNMKYKDFNTRDAFNILSHKSHRQPSKSKESRNTQKYGNDFPQKPPLLTLFTTWNNSKENFARRNTTVSNWAQLTPQIIPVLFTNDQGLQRNVEQKGWRTLPVLKSKIGIPVLKNMYLEAMEQFNSTFYAYANGDILFTDTLLTFLRSVSENETLLNNTLLIVGQRTNVKNVSAKEAVNFALLKNASKTRGKLFTTWAEDYFITTKNFPWSDMPSVVVGRRAYDNFLVLESIKQHFIVIDATKTILAIHHTTNAGNFENRKKAHSDFNAALISKFYNSTAVNYFKGRVDCANHYSDTLKNGTNIVRKKKFTSLLDSSRHEKKHNFLSSRC
uniref:Uncharacterized protein LOC111111937 n=1 Tax=Crassostrea virginica TaxID=6565 RepID=A0A8B8BPK7_CRAVI|nr:uncharacterized protein LOC111111937 [Crassostrea virginica]